MAGLSRRRFLGRGSLTVAAATVMAAAPGVVPAVVSAVEDTPLTDEEIGAVGSADGALVAHIRDLAAGEISVFSGTREVVIRDPGMAARLARAVR